MATIYGFSLKGIKTFKGREGEGCQGDIYYDGKKVGWYSDNADGGMADIEGVADHPDHHQKQDNGGQNASLHNMIPSLEYRRVFPLSSTKSRNTSPIPIRLVSR